MCCDPAPTYSFSIRPIACCSFTPATPTIVTSTGGSYLGETSIRMTLADAAIRELTEETGIVLGALGPCMWIRETRFRYRHRDHCRRAHVSLRELATSCQSDEPDSPKMNEQACSAGNGGGTPI